MFLFLSLFFIACREAKRHWFYLYRHHHVLHCYLRVLLFQVHPHLQLLFSLFQEMMRKNVVKTAISLDMQMLSNIIGDFEAIDRQIL